MTKVAVVVSHPIQHFCPQYSSWSKLPGVDLNVIFASKHGLTPYEDPGFGRTIQWPGITLDFSHEFLPGSGDRKLGLKIDTPDLDVSLKKFLPSVLVIYGYSQRLQRRALQWAVKNKTPVLMISDSELHSQRNLFKKLIKRVVLPEIYKKVSIFLTVGDSNEAYYRHYGVLDFQLVRCFFPIDRSAYDVVLSQREMARVRVRDALGVPVSHKVILSVGKLVPWKRQMDLVKFSNNVQKNRKDITVVLAGTGRDEENLKKDTIVHGAGGVIFAGFVPPDVLAEYYCAADVYTHCSEHEPHSLAISEAIYCGLPVVISDRCGSYGPTDDVRNGLNGLVYRCGDAEDLSRRLLAILDKGDICVQMSEASQHISRQHQALAHGKALVQALAIIDLEK